MRVLIKIGGRALQDEPGYLSLALSLRKSKKNSFILVHGGGAEITEALRSQNRETRFVDGLRVTTEEDIAIIEKVLSGTINERIARYLEESGVAPRRMSGKTRSLLRIEPMKRKGRSLGFVGSITGVNPAPVLDAIKQNQVPVISPISADGSGRTYNVNADSAAAEIAIGAQCTDLVYFTDVPGIRSGGDVLNTLTVSRAKELIRDGIIKAGMIAKLESAFRALDGGVKRVIITVWQGDDTLENIFGKKLKQGTSILPLRRQTPKR